MAVEVVLEELELEAGLNGKGRGSRRDGLLQRVQGAPKSVDHFQTPEWVASVILPYLPPQFTIWESAAGKGNLVRAFRAAGRQVIASDILTGQNFFTDEPDQHWDVQVTNVPFSLKDRWLARSYSLEKPFALLLPLAALGEQARMAMYRERGIGLVMPDQRINYETPSGEGAGAWFFTCFFCWRLPLPSQIVFWSRGGGPAQLSLLEMDR